MNRVKTALESERFIFFEGAMGSYYSEKYDLPSEGVENANITNPERIYDIHRDYALAGCRAIKTNTFAAYDAARGNDKILAGIIESGYDIAKKVGDEFGSLVFADIGPIETDGAISVKDAYIKVVDTFLSLGADNFLFESNSALSPLKEVCSYIKSKNKDAYIIVSFAARPDGFTVSGENVQRLFDLIKENDEIDCAGLNCVSGATHMSELLSELDLSGLTLSVMPNAGYPTIVRRRTVYDNSPGYFAERSVGLCFDEVRFVGGCCGTSPEHMRLAIEKIKSGKKPAKPNAERPERRIIKTEKSGNAFYEKLERGEKVIAVEIDPPENADTSGFVAGADAVKNAGADIITIADCPIARASIDSGILGCKLRRELGIDALPHMTCRDRNLNASKAVLLGVYSEGIRNVLVVTGDPVPGDGRGGVKGVYQFNSRMLAGYISSLSQTLPEPIRVFGALNVNAPNFEMQLGLAEKKVESGIVGFLTQPILSERALENLARAKETLGGYILGGIMPVVSERNAIYMNGEINGIYVEEKIIARYRGKNREECEATAKEISVDIAKKIMPYTDGFYLMTPFRRYPLVCEIVNKIKELF